MNLRPLSDYVLIRRDTADDVSKGGIYIPEVGKEKPVFGTVLAVGRGRIDDKGQLHEPQVIEGERVVFSKYGGSEVRGLDGDGQFLMIREQDILGVVE